MTLISKNKTKVFFEYVSMYLLISVSGMPFFYLGPYGTVVCVFIVLLLLTILVFKKWLTLSKRIRSYIFIVTAIVFISVLIQAIDSGFFPIIFFNKFFTRLIFAYLVLCIVKENFFIRYVNVLYILGIIGLCIHISTLLIPSLFDFFIDQVVPLVPNQFDKSMQIWHNYHIIIFDFWQHDLFRNSGAFWEPGANAGFTLLAMFFNMFLFNKKIWDKKNILFILVVISTLSTAGYASLLVLLFINPQFKQKLGLKIVSFFCVFILATYAIENLDFLGEKLLNQLSNISTSNAHSSRFASARLDFETFQNHPFGFSAVDFRGGERNDADFRTNGFFILLSNYGIILFLLYFTYAYLGFRLSIKYLNFSARQRLNSFYFIAFIILISLSENYFERPLFMCFSMLYAFFPKHIYYTSGKSDLDSPLSIERPYDIKPV